MPLTHCCSHLMLQARCKTHASTGNVRRGWWGTVRRSHGVGEHRGLRGTPDPTASFFAEISFYLCMFTCFTCFSRSFAEILLSESLEFELPPRTYCGESFGWHYLSNATCLMRPHLFSVFFVVPRVTISCYIIRHV